MKNWTVGVPDRKIVSGLVFGCQVSSLTAAALAAKGYTTPESVSDNLNISELSDPFLILDMEKAADTINSAIENGEKVWYNIDRQHFHKCLPVSSNHQARKHAEYQHMKREIIPGPRLFPQCPSARR